MANIDTNMIIDEFDANAVVQALTIARLMALKDARYLEKYLKDQEIKVDGVWNRPSLKAIAKAEKKFIQWMLERGLPIPRDHGTFIGDKDYSGGRCDIKDEK